MSITKGAMLISNANAVGTELVNQLGGTGYKPVEWSDKINLLGINSVDAPYAIKSIQAGTYTGDERGAIRYSNCNAVGSMLNKKLNTNRGFKPVEWPSAIKVLKALTENTVSGDICNVSDGADRVPLKSWEVEIAPTLTGKSAIEATQTERNLISANDESKTFSANVITNYDVASLELKKGVTYTFSAYQNTAITGSTRNTLRITFDENYTYESSGTNFHNQAGVHSMSITPAQDGTAVFAIWEHTPNEDVTYSQFMVEIGSSVSTFEPYTAPTVSTVNLGRTIYGGTADVVKGEGSETHGLITDFSTLRSNGTSSTGAYRYIMDVSGMGDYNAGACVSNLLNYRVSYNANVGEFYNTSNVLIVFLSQDNETDARTYLANNSCKVAYPFVTPTDFTFDAITPTPETNTSVNFWNDTGSNTITYYQAPTALTRSTVSGSIASFSDADTRLTCVNAIATIPPSISGVDSVQLVDAGKNLFDKSTVTANTWIIVNSTDTEPSNSYSTSDYIRVEQGKRYFVSFKDSNRSAYYDLNKNGIEYFSFNGNASFTALYDGYIRITIKNDVDLDTFIINEGNTQETYEAYNGTTYTANLPSTNYGGSVDFVNGDVTNGYIKYVIDGINVYGYLTGSNYMNIMPYGLFIDGTISKWLCDPITANSTNFGYNSSQGFIFIRQSGWSSLSGVTDEETFNAYCQDHPITLILPVTTPTTGSITGQAIIPKTGTNNCYNNVGGNTEITYFTNT